MKVALINTYETKGGAAVACKRLAIALQKQGLEVTMMVRDQSSSDPFVYPIAHSPILKAKGYLAFILERWQIFLYNRFERKNLFTVSTASTGLSLHTNPKILEADIIHLHWINQGFLTLNELRHLFQLGKPVFWTMHDLWPVTGICHYPGQCHYFRESCGNCHLLKSPSSNDLSRKVFQQKKNRYKGLDIHFVACSNWLKQEAMTSALNPGHTFQNIPNPIDTTWYHPGNQLEARINLGLPTHKKLILFGAQIATDKRKGIDYLIQTTNLLSDLKDEVELVHFGQIKEKMAEVFGLHTHALGYISDPETVVTMYQAADCFVIPSLEENLPNMIMEAMACGVPCVGFDTGGIPEMIQHEHTGYIARYKSSEDLAKGIRWVLSKNNDLQFKQAVRQSVLEKYAEPIVAERYIKLYQEALKNDITTR
jgi:glycosyltransferase involved in cell wall biosynthesis